MVRTHHMLALNIRLRCFCFYLLGLQFYFFLFFFVFFKLVFVVLALLQRRQFSRKLHQMPLTALGLIKIPLIRGLGFFQHCLVLEQDGFILRRPALIADDCTYGGQNGSKNGDVCRQSVSLGMMLNFMLVSTVNMKSIL